MAEVADGARPRVRQETDNINLYLLRTVSLREIGCNGTTRNINNVGAVLQLFEQGITCIFLTLDAQLQTDLERKLMD